VLFLIIAAIVIGGWYWYSSRKQSPTDSASAAAPGGSGSGKGGRGNPANAVIPVLVATSTKGDLPVYYNGLGNVTPLNTVVVRSRVDGELLNVAFQEGQFVKQGDLLAQIDPRPYQVQLEQAEGQLAKDQAQQKNAELDYARFQQLYKEGVIAKQQLDTQQALTAQFDGSIKSDQAQIDNAKLQLTYSRITAPLTGRIGLRLVDPGNMVHASDANGLLTIMQVQPIAVLFTLPQDQLPDVYPKLRAGDHLTVEAYDRDNIAKLTTGRLLTIDNQIDPTTGTFKLKAEFSNQDNTLFPNQFLNVHLLVGTKPDLVIIPSAALLRGQQGPYVYVLQADQTVKARNVVVALTAGNSIGLSSGLQAGETVVTDGQDKLQDGSKVTPSSSVASALAAAESDQGKGQGGGKRGGAGNAPGAPANDKKPSGDGKGRKQ